MNINDRMTQASAPGEIEGWWFDATSSQYVKVEMATASKLTMTGLVDGEVVTKVVPTKPVVTGEFFFAGNGEEPVSIADVHGVKNWTITDWWDDVVDKDSVSYSDDPEDTSGAHDEFNGEAIETCLTDTAPTTEEYVRCEVSHRDIVLRIVGVKYRLSAVWIPVGRFDISTPVSRANDEEDESLPCIGGDSNSDFRIEVEAADGTTLFSEYSGGEVCTPMAVVERM